MTTTQLDPAALDFLVRFDAPMVVLSAGIAFYILTRFFKAWLEDGCSREVQLGLIFACWAGWVAWELFMLVVGRSAVIAGLDPTAVLNARWRAVLPAVGVALAIATVHWLGRDRLWITGAAVVLAIAMALWPVPLRLAALLAYRLLVH